MKKIVSASFAFYLVMALISCQSGNSNTSATDSSGNKPVVLNPTNDIPEFRKEVAKEPVDQFREKTDNPINDWYFSVKLYETPVTFHYLIKMQFEELTGEDTLKLPNFGTIPKPVIKKGDAKYSCIIGFMDNENKFREYKLVHVDGNQLKITTLKHYAVATYQK
ncbi:MAG: hypothetical protein JST87_18275 [Bacteroidetes bacterium]|nr:hypothetical protein [Bacteroidota bacterium]